MTKPKTERGIKEETALQAEIDKLNFERSEIDYSLNDKYQALSDLRKDEQGFLHKLDNDDSDFFGV